MRYPGKKCRRNQNWFDEECMESKRKTRGALNDFKEKETKQNKVLGKQRGM
jgi:hypothetical protein